MALQYKVGQFVTFGQGENQLWWLRIAVNELIFYFWQRVLEIPDSKSV